MATLRFVIFYYPNNESVHASCSVLCKLYILPPLQFGAWVISIQSLMQHLCIEHIADGMAAKLRLCFIVCKSVDSTFHAISLSDSDHMLLHLLIQHHMLRYSPLCRKSDESTFEVLFVTCIFSCSYLCYTAATLLSGTQFPDVRVTDMSQGNSPINMSIANNLQNSNLTE